MFLSSMLAIKSSIKPSHFWFGAVRPSVKGHFLRLRLELLFFKFPLPIRSPWSSDRALVWHCRYEWSEMVGKVFLGRHHSGFPPEFFDKSKIFEKRSSCQAVEKHSGSDRVLVERGMLTLPYQKSTTNIDWGIGGLYILLKFPSRYVHIHENDLRKTIWQ